MHQVDGIFAEIMMSIKYLPSFAVVCGVLPVAAQHLQNPDVLVQTAGVTLGAQCADFPHNSKYVWIEPKMQNGKPTALVIAVCRAVKEVSAGQEKVSASFQYFSMHAGSKLNLGCFMPGFNELHVAWVGAGNSKPDFAVASSLLTHFKIGEKYTIYHNNHLFRSVKIEYTMPNGSKKFVTLKPSAEVSVGSLKSVQYAFPIQPSLSLNPTDHCYSLGDTTNPPTKPYL